MQELEWEMLEMLGRAGVELAGAHVAEVGCGSGYFLSRMLGYGAVHAAGIDLMEDRIGAARAGDPRLELTAGNAAELPWADRSFEVVTQFTCLSSILDPGLRRAVADEMWRVVRPGGAILSYDMRSMPRPVRTVHRVLALGRKGFPGVSSTPTAPVDLAELRALLPAAVIDSCSLTLATDLAFLAERSPAAARVLGALGFLQTHLLVVAVKPR